VSAIKTFKQLDDTIDALKRRIERLQEENHKLQQQQKKGKQ